MAVTARAAQSEAIQDNGSPKSATGDAQVSHASSDDCEIIVEVGKAKVNWGFAGAEYAFYPVFDLPGGGTYVEDCDWHKFGVGAPTRGGPDSTSGFFITRPFCAGDQATVHFQYFLKGKNGASFMEAETCTLEKREGRWHLLKCDLNAIT